LLSLADEKSKSFETNCYSKYTYFLDIEDDKIPEKMTKIVHCCWVVEKFQIEITPQN